MKVTTQKINPKPIYILRVYHSEQSTVWTIPGSPTATVTDIPVEQTNIMWLFEQLQLFENITHLKLLIRES